MLKIVTFNTEKGGVNLKVSNMTNIIIDILHNYFL